VLDKDWQAHLAAYCDEIIENFGSISRTSYALGCIAKFLSTSYVHVALHDATQVTLTMTALTLAVT
jgi:hypothetical protein